MDTLIDIALMAGLIIFFVFVGAVIMSKNSGKKK
tara:strand:+ start:119680 stop:119781 length:102 start_codon:yes stop_codon:yes gene_type:complete